MEDLQNSALKFFSDQELCNVDIVPPAQVIMLFHHPSFFVFLFLLILIWPAVPFRRVQVRARIEVSVLNFLKILNASNPAISDLPLVQFRLIISNSFPVSLE